MDIGVIGVGKLGSIHARIYKEIYPQGNLWVCDVDEEKGRRIAQDFKANFVKDYRHLAGKVNAVSIATPTLSHFKIAEFFLKNSVCCLVEKPITTNIEQANRLTRLAKKNKVFLMVGMVERFNSAYQKIKKIIRNPRFIECHRLGPYPARSLDISVVLDLMIHDLDIILDLVGRKIKKVEGVGIKVLSKSCDIANVRINFQGGGIANVTSSRVSDEKVRKIRIFFASSYISLDYAQQQALIYQKKNNSIKKETLKLTPYEPLKKEIEYFLDQINKKKFNYHIADRSIEALKLALKIEKIIQ
ncbi:MAG: Gfo/Idh/MocA family oxidoreductase [Candidatus Omnitrophica bacterium]|nr:Gfo/Idh/MocA family oxidoreductase [Candidatus Omnitrophota bacterium]